MTLGIGHVRPLAGVTPLLLARQPLPNLILLSFETRAPSFKSVQRCGDHDSTLPILLRKVSG